MFETDIFNLIVGYFIFILFKKKRILIGVIMAFFLFEFLSLKFCFFTYYSEILFVNFYQF